MISRTLSLGLCLSSECPAVNNDKSYLEPMGLCLSSECQAVNNDKSYLEPLTVSEFRGAILEEFVDPESRFNPGFLG
jgi:hypothetical protein